MIKKRTSIFLIISLLCCLCILSVNATEDDILEESDYGLVDIGYRPNTPEKSTDVESGALDLPPSYDPRSTNAVTPVKNQSSNGVCWSFGIMGTLESKIYRETGLKENLSEEAIRYIQSNYTEEYLGNSSDLGLYSRKPYDAGNALVGVEYISQKNNAISNDLSWVSPNLTSDIPYINNIIYVNNKPQIVN